MESFYWLIEGMLAGCGRPGYRRGRLRDQPAQLLDADLGWLDALGIGALLSLTEEPLDAAALERSGLIALHLPVPDLTPPTPEQLQVALGFVDEQRARGHAVAVHCLIGQGRTGTVLAAHLIRDGLSVAEALETLRMVCPGAVGSPSQERALERYERQRGWVM